MKKPQCESFCRKYYGWISFASNIFNAGLKIGVGIVTQSQALIADGFHSLSDSLTAIVTIATLRVSGRPSDASHPYGHGKIEFISACLFSLMLMTLAGIITVRAIISMLSETLAPPNFLAAGPALISILTNIAVSNYGLCVGREINSPVITANAKENNADAMSSVASLTGIIAAVLGFPKFDPLAAIAVAACIAYMGYQIFHESASGLMDAAIGKEDRDVIRRLVRSVPGVQRLAFLRTRRIGQKIWADVGIKVSPTLTLDEADSVAHEVRNALMRRFPRMQDAVVYLESEPAFPEKRRWYNRVALLLRRQEADR